MIFHQVSSCRNAKASLSVLRPVVSIKLSGYYLFKQFCFESTLDRSRESLFLPSSDIRFPLFCLPLLKCSTAIRLTSDCYPTPLSYSIKHPSSVSAYSIATVHIRTLTHTYSPHFSSSSTPKSKQCLLRDLPRAHVTMRHALSVKGNSAEQATHDVT